MSVIQPQASNYGVTGITGTWTSQWFQPYSYASLSVTWLSDVDTTVDINQSPDGVTTFFTDTYSGVGGTAQNQLLNIKCELIQIEVTFDSNPSTFVFETFANSFFFSNSVTGPTGAIGPTGVTGPTGPNNGSYVLISSQTLGTGASNITINSIPGTYNHLKLIGSFKTNYNNSNLSDSIFIQYNGDTGGNYANQYLIASNGTSTTAGGVVSGNTGARFTLCGSTGAVSGFSTSEALIAEYTNTSKYKIITSNFSAYNANIIGLLTGVSNGTWLNTSAITSMVFYSASNSTLLTGSSIYIYGI